jgi:uncharacterized membrane protein (UPF0127 family)
MGNGGAAKRLSLAVLLALVLAGPSAAACTDGTVEVRGPGGQARFTVEVADSADERARGLMFRESMPSSAGMLFVYERPGRTSFWMKNTLIPLDIIFADDTGEVTRVHENARPMDTTSIDGGQNVKLVLEINGGLAGRLGIGPGAVLRHPRLDPARAAWPCPQ